jgi:2-polyprenyl-3-methyl-5-hydroxy-6-metoxy-1,4-benzoquinol methylase
MAGLNTGNVFFVMNTQRPKLENRKWTARERKDVVCNVCSSGYYTHITQENECDIVQCTQCKTIYVKQQPSNNELADFYAQYVDVEAHDKWEQAMHGLFEQDKGRINTLHDPGKILDIGCCFGFFLHTMQHCGWETHGCDLSPVATRYAQHELGLSNVRCGSILDLDYTPGSFDVITAWYVLHHLPDPKGVLQKIYTLLKPGGIVALRLPNINLLQLAWWLQRFDSLPLRTFMKSIRKETSNEQEPFNVLDPPYNLFGFSPQTLCDLGRRLGFHPLWITNDGMLNRGNLINRVVDSTLKHGATCLKRISRGRWDYSISFSYYGQKPEQPAKV